jgi:hypothetical protein
MSMKPCGKGHYYNSAEHRSCPFCGVPVALGSTRVLAVAADYTQPDRSAPPLQRDPEATRPLISTFLGGIDPVVGWLVCIEGPDRGRDYRLRGERNFIGRNPAMDIAITGDDTISRERHAIISHDPRRQTFRLAAGDGRGLVYHNDEEVVEAVLLAPYDRIELGRTKLLFIPFCGERFTWSASAGEG